MIKYLSKKINNKKGFTLVELIVVVAILGILTTLAVPKLSKSRADAAIVAHNANVRTLESVATLAVSEGVVDVTWKKTENVTGDKGWENYLQAWPELPKGLLDADGNPIGDEYSVEIDTNGDIKINHSKIEDAE